MRTRGALVELVTSLDDLDWVDRILLGKAKKRSSVLAEDGFIRAVLREANLLKKEVGLAAGALSERGVLCFSLTSQATALDESGAIYLGSIKRALEEAFGDVLNTGRFPTEAELFMLLSESMTEWAMNNVVAFFDDVQLYGWLEGGAENEELSVW